MSREKQRRNRRLKEQRQKQELLDSFMKGEFNPGEKKDSKPWLNHEGYHDPTAYKALKNCT